MSTEASPKPLKTQSTYCLITVGQYVVTNCGLITILQIYDIYRSYYLTAFEHFKMFTWVLRNLCAGLYCASLIKSPRGKFQRTGPNFPLCEENYILLLFL